MLNRAREWWERLGRTNQITLALTTIGLLVALIGFVAWAGTPEYAPLFSNLSAQDANAITDKLREANVPSRLTQGGTGIEVPAQYVDESRMKMLSQGLPQQSQNAGTGDDIFTKNQMMQTSEMEQLAMRRSLEERVSRSIMSLQPISNATVHFASPDNSPFAISNHDASASIIVTCKPGGALSDGNVRAIVRLTQMSCTGLQDKNISLVNSQGELLWDGAHTGGVEGSERAKQQREIEIAKRTDLQTALDKTIGPRHTLVVVNAELNNDDRIEHKVTIEPGPPSSKAGETEKLNDAGKVNGAAVAPGAGPNGVAPPGGAANGTPTYPKASPEGASSTFDHVISHVDFANGQTVLDTHSSQGKIEKLTVSVLLDSDHFKDPALLTATQATIKQMVETSIGVDPADLTHARSVSVSALPFDRSQEMQDAQLGEQQHRAELMRQLAGLLVPFAIMGIALFLLARALRRPALVPPSQMPALAGGAGGMSALPPMPELLLDENGDPIPGQRVGNATEEMNEDDSPIGLSHGVSAPRIYEVIEEQFDANLESILHMTRSKPDMVAMLVKSWVNEDQ